MLAARRWVDAFLHLPCTHQVLSDNTACQHKMMDDRTFWGVALFIYSLCTDAERVVVEQPPTIIPRSFRASTAPLHVSSDLAMRATKTASLCTCICVEGGSLGPGHLQVIDVSPLVTSAFETLPTPTRETAGAAHGHVFPACVARWCRPRTTECQLRRS